MAPSTTTSVASTAPRLGDPFAARTQQSNPQGGVDESSVASAISQSGSRSYPTLADSFQGQAEQPKPHAVSAPDESKIAATLGAHSDTGPQARGAGVAGEAAVDDPAGAGAGVRRPLGPHSPAEQ